MIVMNGIFLSFRSQRVSADQSSREAKEKKWAGDAEWRAGVGVFRPANSTFQNFSSLQRNKKGMSEGTKHQSSGMDPMSQKKRGENKQAAAVASGAIAVAGPQWK